MVNVSTNDNSDRLFQALESLKDLEVYVGIPEEKSSRNEKNDSITNAELAFLMTNGVRKIEMREDMSDSVDRHGYHAAYNMYIQANGSPLWQIPPRPIIEPAIADDKDNLSPMLADAAKAILDGDRALALQHLNKAGLEGQAAAQDWFTNPKNGWLPNAQPTIDAKGSDKPNIDTGELRKAITYVVKGE
jgi:hypothetical protein